MEEKKIEYTLEALQELTVYNLKALATELNIITKGKNKKIDIINSIAYELNLKPQRKVLEKIREQHVIQQEEEKKIEGKIIACCKYEDRYIVIVSIPEQHTNPNDAWIKRHKCRNLAFYLSTGTSNVANFPGIWMPFLRIDSNGWIHKEHSGLQYDYTHHMKIAKPEFYNSTKSGIVEAFMKRFSRWWIMQISAALPSDPDSLWNTNSKMAFLKAFLLSVYYDSIEHEFETHPQICEMFPIITHYRLPENCEINLTTPEKVNDFLMEHDALCLREDKKSYD